MPGETGQVTGGRGSEHAAFRHLSTATIHPLRPRRRRRGGEGAGWDESGGGARGETLQVQAPAGDRRGGSWNKPSHAGSPLHYLYTGRELLPQDGFCGRGRCLFLLLLLLLLHLSGRNSSASSLISGSLSTGNSSIIIRSAPYHVHPHLFSLQLPPTYLCFLRLVSHYL